MYFVEVQGRKLGYEMPRGGRLSPPQGHVVLLVHGAFDNREYWCHVYRHLEARHTPLAIDLPGRGGVRRPGPAGRVGVPGLFRCSRRSDRSAALRVLRPLHGRVDGAPVRHASRGPALGHHPAELCAGLGDRRGRHRRMGPQPRPGPIGTTWGISSRGKLRRRRGGPTKGRCESTPAASCKADLVTCRSFDLAHRLDEIRVPATVVSGDQEFWIAGSQSLHRGIAGSRLELVPAAGHAIALEQPAALNAVLDRALASIA